MSTAMSNGRSDDRKSSSLIVIVLIVIICAGVGLFLLVRYDYTWHQSNLATYTQNGWLFAFATTNVVDISRPWTIIKQPVEDLWLIDYSGVTRLAPDVYLVHILKLKREGNPRYEDWYELARTSDDSLAFLRGVKFESALREGVQALRSDTAEWHSFEEGTPGYGVTKAVRIAAQRQNR